MSDARGRSDLEDFVPVVDQDFDVIFKPEDEGGEHRVQISWIFRHDPGSRFGKNDLFHPLRGGG